MSLVADLALLREGGLVSRATYNPGSDIGLSGIYMGKIYLVENGLVSVEPAARQRRIPRRILRPSWTFLGELSLYLHRSWTASVCAVSTTVCHEWNSTQWWQAQAREPMIMARVLWMLMACGAARIHEAAAGGSPGVKFNGDALYRTAFGRVQAHTDGKAPRARKLCSSLDATIRDISDAFCRLEPLG
jgi:hypothetical protein